MPLCAMGVVSRPLVGVVVVGEGGGALPLCAMGVVSRPLVGVVVVGEGGGALPMCAIGVVSRPFGEAGASPVGGGILPSAPGVPGATPRLPANSTVLADTTAMLSASPFATRSTKRAARTSPLRFASFNFSQSR
jgi:hypothetical protein